MTHRVFIAINLPPEVKKQLLNYQEKITALFPERCPIRWTGEENLHLTLVFLGAISNDELTRVCHLCRESGKNKEVFSLTLKQIAYGPPKAMPPRMVWVIGEKSAELAALKSDLEKALTAQSENNYTPDERAFSPHLTLGRIKGWEFRQIEPEERPEINEALSLGFQVNSFEIMESELRSAGPKYTILESIPLIED